MSKAYGYMRCSGKGQILGDTWDRQAEDIRRFAAEEGFTVERLFAEEAVPGKTEAEDREAFQEMVYLMCANGVKTVIVESLDRFAREYRVQEQLVIYLAAKKLTLYSANTGENVTEAMMADPMRRALVQIQGIFAELDKNLTINKLRKARARIRSRGERCEGRKPFGARPGEEAILAEILNLRRLGWTPAGIAQTLNQKQVPTRYQRRWHAGTVAKILRNQNGGESTLGNPPIFA